MTVLDVDTALSDYKSARRHSVAIHRRDRELRSPRVRLGFYVSLLDCTTRPTSALRERSGLAWSDYLEFLRSGAGTVHAQRRHCGVLAGRLLAHEWPIAHVRTGSPGGDFGFAELCELIHTLQPDAV